MGAITLPNFRTTADVRMNTKLKDGGVYIEWSSLTEVKAWIWSDAQKALAGRVEVSVDTGDATVLKCLYASTKPQYPGVNRLIVQGRYNGSLKTYDKPVFNFVPRTAEATGSITISDPEVDVEIEVTDTTSSILDNTIAAALAAAAHAEHAASLVPLQVLQDCEAATAVALTAASKAPVIGENGHWWVWNSQQAAYVDTGKQAKGDTGNGIASFSVVESQEDDADNVVTVTFTDGTTETFAVKNGKTGNGIASIVQTVESPDDAGTNVITVTMTNGTVITFNVKNGSKGQPGAAQAAYKSVETLPTASAETMDKIYLTPSATAGVYNMSYTDFDGTSYSWVSMGTTAIQLSDYATNARLDQLVAEVTDLGVELGKKKTYSVPVTSGTQLNTTIPVNFPEGTVIRFKLQATDLITTSVNLYLLNGGTSTNYTLFTDGSELDILAPFDVDSITFNRSSSGVVGTGTIVFEQTVIENYASGNDFKELQEDTVGVDISTKTRVGIPFKANSGETFVVKNKTNKTLSLYFRVKSQSSSNQQQIVLNANESGTITAERDFYYLYVVGDGEDPDTDWMFHIEKTTSLDYRIKQNASAITAESTERAAADTAIEGGLETMSKYVYDGKRIYLKGVSGSNIKLKIPIVLSQDGDSFEISCHNDTTNNNNAYGFANSGLSTNGNYAIQLGFSYLGVRSSAGAWLFKDTSFTGTKDVVLKIEYTGGKVVTKVNGTTINTYNSQPAVQIDSFGDGGNGTYGYWKGTIDYVKVGGNAYDLFTKAVLNNVGIVGGSTDPEGVLQYDSANSRFNFFSRYRDDKYFSFEVEHEVDADPTVLKNLWRVKYGYLQKYSNGAFEQDVVVLHNLENEWAAAFSGFQAFGGFVGGYHGGELITDAGCYVKFLADGKEITSAMMASDFSLNCKEFKYIQYAGLHKVQTTGDNPSIIEGQPIFAYHTKITTITGGKMHTLNIVHFVDNVTRTAYHSGLFCTGKAAATNVVLPVGVIATALAGGNNYIDADYKLVGKVYAWNDTNNISAEMDSKFVDGIDDAEMLLTTGQFCIWNRTNDSKYYRRTLKSVAVASGETIVTESSIAFKA